MSGTAAPPAPDAVQTSEEPEPSGFSAGPLLVVALSFVVSMVVGALLIAVTDRPTRTAAGHFFDSPGTVFSKAWHAVSGAYVALFQGAIFDPHTFGHGTVLA